MKSPDATGNNNRLIQQKENERYETQRHAWDAAFRRTRVTRIRPSNMWSHGAGSAIEPTDTNAGGGRARTRVGVIGNCA